MLKNVRPGILKGIMLALSALVLLLLVGIVLIRDRRVYQLTETSPGKLMITQRDTLGASRTFDSWEDEQGRYYFFLPSYVKDHRLYFDGAGIAELKSEGGSTITGVPIEDGEIFSIVVASSGYSYDVTIKKSGKVPATFINTKSGNMTAIYEDRDYEEPGDLTIVRADGSVDYSGSLVSIGGKGNSSWEQAKRPLKFETKERVSLLGMQNSSKWVLDALYREGSGLANEIAFDMARALEMDFVADSEYTDLYLNGNYVGLYKISNRVTAYLEENPADIFFERENNPKETNELWTSGLGVLYSSRAGKKAEDNRIELGYGLIDEIEQSLSSGTQDWKKYLDIPSVADKYLVDEVTLNPDGNTGSLFYVLKDGEERICSGPVWDYDMGFGESGRFNRNMNFEGKVTNYDRPEEGETENRWYVFLTEDEEFLASVREQYESKLLPRLKALVETDIDERYDYIREAASCNDVRWKDMDRSGDFPGHYSSRDLNVRYVKFFLAKRVNYLNKLWGIESEELRVPDNRSTHRVRFYDVDGDTLLDEMTVGDGEVITETPELPPADDGEQCRNWLCMMTNEKYTPRLPVYEDIDFIAEE